MKTASWVSSELLLVLHFPLNTHRPSVRPLLVQPDPSCAVDFKQRGLINAADREAQGVSNAFLLATVVDL